MRHLLLPLAAIALLLPPSVHTQSSGIRVVRVTAADAPNTAEVSVAIDPTNRDHVVVSAYQINRPGGTRVTNVLFVSRDGGRTWTEEVAANPERRASQGDDAVVFDADGTLFHSYISFDGLRVSRPPLARNGIFVRRRDPQPRGWEGPVAVIDHRNTVAPFEDKPWPGVDRGAQSPHRGHVFVAWTRFDEYGTTRPDCRSEIHFSRSTDGGRSFAVPQRISDRQGGCLDDDDTVEGAVPSAAPTGEVYVAWSGPAGLVVDRSDDGGVTFGDDRLVTAIPGGWDIDVPGLSRSNGMPVTVVDGTTGPTRGRVYIAWIDARHGDPDVFVTWSDDKGASWATPVRVNDDPIGSGRQQFFVWIAVDQSTGHLHAVYHDRLSPTATDTRVMLARSEDGGRTWANTPVPVPAFPTTAEVPFGDYNGIDAAQGRVVAAFPHFVGEKQVGVSVAIVDGW